MKTGAARVQYTRAGEAPAVGLGNPHVGPSCLGTFGVRDISPDAERLERSAIYVVEWRDERPQDDVLAAIDKLATRVRDVYLHVDFDGFAPEIAPGVVDEPVPGGLSSEDAEMIIRATGDGLQFWGGDAGHLHARARS